MLRRQEVPPVVLWMRALIFEAVAHPEVDIFLVILRSFIRIHVLLLPRIHQVISVRCVLQLPESSLPRIVVEIYIMGICAQVLSVELVV
jgi:hypothetical protein